MRPISGCVYSCFLVILFFTATRINPQPQVSSPTIVLEAISTIHGIGGHEDTLLLVRLTDDGKVEWDKYVGDAWERQTSSVTAERVSEIQRTLDSIDKSLVHGTMGPYYVYVDTYVTLQIHITARQGEVAFSVMNPWPSSDRHKQMPKDVKVVVCEIDRLHAQVANVPIIEMCKSSNSSH